VEIHVVYSPPGDLEIQALLHEHLGTRLHNAKMNKTLCIITGDLNAKYRKEDYNYLSPPEPSLQDRRHTQWLTQYSVSPFNPSPSRRHTYYRPTCDPGSDPYSSRVDDLLHNALALNPTLPPMNPDEEILTWVVGSDHRPILSRLPNHLIGLTNQPHDNLLKHPTKNPFKGITWNQIEHLTPILQTMLTDRITVLTNKCNSWLLPDSPPPCPEELDLMGQELSNIFLAFQDRILQLLGKKPPPRTAIRVKHRLPRKLQRKVEVAFKAVGEIQELLSTTTPYSPEYTYQASKLTNAKKHAHQTWREARKEDINQAIGKARHTYEHNRKDTHRKIFQSQPGPDTPTDQEPPAALSAIIHPSNKVVRTDAAGILHATHTFFHSLLSPTHIVPNTNIPPWLHGSCPPRDKMSLWNAPPEPSSPIIMTVLEDTVAFLSQMGSLSTGTATGPGGLTNEALRWAPEDAKRLLHCYLLCLWKHGYTPVPWSHSHVRLLHKKGPTELLGNYRPIAISDALCKVWTGLVARGLSAFADANHIFSTAQEGFRAQKNSQRQIRNLLNAVEDAHLTSQDIYTLYVDFSAAFSMVNHERLQECLHTFGIPDDAR